MSAPSVGSDDSIRVSADALYRRLMRHRERYVRAWLAATGMHPNECELVEERHTEDGVVRQVVCVRRRSR